MYGMRLLLLALVAALSSAGPVLRSAHGGGPQPLVDRPFVLVLDPGHGGTNRGCQSFDGHTHEKDVTLALARELRDELARRMPHARVVLTRERDETLTLAERVTLANDNEADVFLSLHANASESHAQQGFETYLLDVDASGLEAARTARRENDAGHSSPRPVDAVMSMVRQLGLTQHRSHAAILAQYVQAEQSTRFPERVDRGVKQAPFDVLMGARMPAVLFEVGFLDHPEEGRALLDGDRRALVVDGLAAAVGAYYRQVATRQ